MAVRPAAYTFPMRSGSQLADLLSDFVRIPSVSYPNHADEDPQAFAEILTLMQRRFPRLFSAADAREHGGRAWTFRWNGSADPLLAPRGVGSHYDVVPIEPGTEADWDHPPFSGNQAAGFIWGRGALDMKGMLVCLLAAAEDIIAEQLSIDRPFLLAIGGDEETGGERGAMRIAAALEAEGTRFFSFLDEGAVIATNAFPGITGPAALVGLSEKGYVDTEITVSSAGGHSMNPPAHSAAGLLAAVVRHIERNPRRTRMPPSITAMLDVLAANTRPPMKTVLRFRRLLRPVLLRVLARSGPSRPLVQSTQAVTMLTGSAAPNVLPQRARAVVNSRLLPGDSVADEVARIEALAAAALAPFGARNMLRVRILPVSFANDPIPAAPQDERLELIRDCVSAQWPDAFLCPYVTTGSTDSKHYRNLCNAIYRIMPVQVSLSETARMHATNERFPIAELPRLYRFFRSYLCGGTSGGTP